MRYSREDKFLNSIKKIKKEKDKLFKTKKIAIIGCGGVGSVISELLVRGGFKNLVIVDNDIIDETNIQRQIYFEKDIGKSKSKCLKRYLKRINPELKIKEFCDVLDKTNIQTIVFGSELIIDATDNFHTRKIINEFCEKNKKNWLYNGAVKGEFMTCMFYGSEKYFNKVFSKNIIDESCCEVGVLSSTTFAAAALAYNQILKYFLGIKEYKIIKMDFWNNRVFEINIKTNNEK